MKELPVIAISVGDPAGVGPEVTLKALLDDETAALARWVLVGDGWLLQKLAKDYSFPDVRAVDVFESAAGKERMVFFNAGALAPEDWKVGELSAACGRAGLEYVRRAVQLCLQGAADALVTAPLNKEAVTLAGEQFTGHTEYIADLCGVRESRMLLVGNQLRVVHVTTHCSLAEAARVSTGRIVETIRLGHRAMKALGLPQARVAVCGLNPHAGENGLFGKEDLEVIAPAVRQARTEGISCAGPLPADTLFVLAARGKFDLVVALYHDQGHIPAKLLDFEGTVNVTLGLPIIRTSVDHGTAFDIAGKNLANPANMKSAMRLAVQLAAWKKLNV